jgi:hypothetical protein
VTGVYCPPYSPSPAVARKDYRAMERILGPCADDHVLVPGDVDCGACPFRTECDALAQDIEMPLDHLEKAVKVFRMKKREVRR